MREIELKPIRRTEEEFDAIEEIILMIFRKEFYLPLLREINLNFKLKNSIHNSREDLLDAIAEGKLSYYRGRFTGRLTSSLSRELKAVGAVWEKGAWRLPQKDLPIEVVNAISASRARFEQAIQRINKKLDKVVPEEIAGKVKLEKLFDDTVWKVERSFQKTIKGITVSPTLTKEQSAKIADEYTNNLRTPINDFLKKEVVKLREQVQSHTFKGYRFEDLAKKFEKSYQVSKKKAAFLARQETNLLIAKFKESRYTSAGVDEYRWGCVHMPKDSSPTEHTPGNVRYFHGIHEGKIFRWDKPPVINSKGERKNPGEDYNCRCFAKPVVKF